MVKKKKILFHSDFALSKTGFGRNTKAILSYLFNTGKYEIVSIAGGISKAHPELERTPWKSIGVVPVLPGAELNDYNSSPEKSRLYAYGAYEVNKVVKEEKPDVYIAVQDFWGVDYSISMPWFNNITSVIWTTLDSLPLLPAAVKEAPNIKNYWVWSNFAEKEMHKLGHSHVKTMHGCIEVEDFKPLTDGEKSSLREKNNISKDDFVIGFVFRNQLRKSVPNLLQGFKIFKDKNPNVSAKLLLHTNWQEGWNILKLCKESEVSQEDILTTYVCKSCRGYEIKNFAGPEINCSYCKTNSSCVTTGVSYGVNEKQLNEIYNCMDVYCHPFTSGGQEIPIQEAKLAGLITLVTNYSCGAEMCCPEAASIPLSWNEYREFGTEFIKASTCPVSIADSLKSVYSMTDKERVKAGRQARKWAIDNFSTENIGAKIEKFIDSAPFAEHKEEPPPAPTVNPEAEIPDIQDRVMWLKTLYDKILGRKVPDDDEGLLHWINKLDIGMSKQTIISFFRSTAKQELAKFKPTTFEDIFADSKKDDRILVAINSSKENVFLATKIIRGIKKKHPNKSIFIFTNKDASDIFLGNDDITDVLVQGKEFADTEFLKNNFYECYALDNFSLNNNHSVFLK
jgi:glycosyltransferase involved in cell wall biosynthesis